MQNSDCYIPHVKGCEEEDISVGRASDWRSTDAGSSPRRGKGFFLSQLPVQTLLRCPYSPRVQSHAPTSVRTLKIPNTGSHTLVCTDENTARTDSLEWVGLLLRLLNALPG